MPPHPARQDRDMAPNQKPNPKQTNAKPAMPSRSLGQSSGSHYKNTNQTAHNKHGNQTDMKSPSKKRTRSSEKVHDDQPPNKKHRQNDSEDDDNPNPRKRNDFRLPPDERKVHPDTYTLWHRSVDQLGTHIWDAIPKDMEVYKVGWGLNWPWPVKLSKTATTTIYCPAFKDNVPLFQLALRYAIACRCKTDSPEIPDELQTFIPNDGQKDDNNGDDNNSNTDGDDEDHDATDGPNIDEAANIEVATDKIMLSVNEVIEQMVNALLVNYVELDGQALSLKARKDEWKAVLKPILEQFRVQDTLPQAKKPQRHAQTKAFLKLIKYPFKKKSTEPVLVTEDFEAIKNAWDTYAEMNGYEPCSHYSENAAKRQPKEKVEKTKKFVGDWPKQAGRLLLYGPYWEEKSGSKTHTTKSKTERAIALRSRSAEKSESQAENEGSASPASRKSQETVSSHTLSNRSSA